jgi:hypothetical protein
MTRTIEVELDGLAIPKAWSGPTIAGVDGVTIRWGRTDLYDQPRPSRAAVTIVDPDGVWSSRPERYGARLIVRQGARVVFRGDVDDIASIERRVHDPVHNKTVTVWLTTIGAVDPRAALDKFIPKGPGSAADELPRTKVYELAFYGPDFWPAARASLRTAHVRDAAGVDKIVSGVELAYVGPDGSAIESQIVAQEKMGASALDLIRRVYLLPGPGHVNYDPDSDSVTRGLLATRGGVRLTRSGTAVVLTGTATHIIPASAFSIPDNPEIVSTFSKAIGRIRAIGTRAKIDPFDYDGNQNTAHRYDYPAENQRTVPTPGRSTDNTLDIDGGYSIYGSTTAYQAGGVRLQPALDDAVITVSALNGRIAAPSLGFDPRRADDGFPVISEALLDVLLGVNDDTTPIYIAGSRYIALEYVGPMFQLIGGTLRYDNGWHVDDMVLAPALSNTPAQRLTVTQLWGTSTATWGDLAPDIHFADFDVVTGGL